MRLLVVLLALAFASCVPASARIINDDPGGILDEYKAEFAKSKAAGEHIAVDGGCSPACTLIFAYPKELVCITPDAWFGFHSAYDETEDEDTGALVPKETDEYGFPVPSEEGTMDLFNSYPEAVQNWVNAHGGIMNAWIVRMTYQDALKFFRPCQARKTAAQ